MIGFTLYMLSFAFAIISLIYLATGFNEAKHKWMLLISILVFICLTINMFLYKPKYETSYKDLVPIKNAVIGSYIRVSSEDSNHLEVFDGEKFYTIYNSSISKSNEKKNRLVITKYVFDNNFQKNFNVLWFLDETYSVELSN